MEIELPVSRRRIRPGKLVCVGRNYALHAAEMRSDVPSEPLLFLKPSSALIASGQDVILPPMSAEIHHEVEIVLVIGKEARRVSEAEAIHAIEGLALGLDMTARDIQADAKKGGKPWSVAKGFDTFAPLGGIVPREEIADLADIGVQLQRNGQLVQSGNTRDMIFSPSFLVHYISSIFTLQPGDLVYTGTPEGVGPVHSGDTLRASADGLPDLIVGVRAAN